MGFCLGAQCRLADLAKLGRSLSLLSCGFGGSFSMCPTREVCFPVQPGKLLHSSFGLQPGFPLNLQHPRCSQRCSVMLSAGWLPAYTCLVPQGWPMSPAAADSFSPSSSPECARFTCTVISFHQDEPKVSWGARVPASGCLVHGPDGARCAMHGGTRALFIVLWWQAGGQRE